MYARIDGEERGGTVMLRPVELHPSRDPRPGQPHQRGLDDVVAVEEVVAGHLVIADVDADADLGQQHQAHVCILERSEEHTSELQSLMRTSYAVFCLKNKKK